MIGWIIAIIIAIVIGYFIGKYFTEKAKFGDKEAVLNAQWEKKIANIDIPLDSGDFCVMNKRVISASCALFLGTASATQYTRSRLCRITESAARA